MAKFEPLFTMVFGAVAIVVLGFYLVGIWPDLAQVFTGFEFVSADGPLELTVIVVGALTTFFCVINVFFLRVSVPRKVGWLAVLMWFHSFAVPVYWYLHLRTEGAKRGVAET